MLLWGKQKEQPLRKKTVDGQEQTLLACVPRGQKLCWPRGLQLEYVRWLWLLQPAAGQTPT